jgi:hypothetical protein
MANDSFLKTAAPLVALTFLAVYNFPAITRGAGRGWGLAFSYPNTVTLNLVQGLFCRKMQGVLHNGP